MQIRSDRAEGGMKYRWFSSNPAKGFTLGTKAQTWIHVTGDAQSKVACVTEDGLKGDVASYFLGGRSLCLRAGGQQPAVPPRNTERPAAEKGGGGLRHGQAGRDARFKGIDDFLYARHLYSTGQAEQIPSITS